MDYRNQRMHITKTHEITTLNTEGNKAPYINAVNTITKKFHSMT